MPMSANARRDGGACLSEPKREVYSRRALNHNDQVRKKSLRANNIHNPPPQGGGAVGVRRDHPTEIQAPVTTYPIPTKIEGEGQGEGCQNGWLRCDQRGHNQPSQLTRSEVVNTIAMTAKESLPNNSRAGWTKLERDEPLGADGRKLVTCAMRIGS